MRVWEFQTLILFG